MTDWRSEPPDAIGWWLWRARKPANTETAALYRVLVGHLYDPNRLHQFWIDPNSDSVDCCHGQWLRVPE